MVLADCVRVARRFQRAIRIDSDLGDPEALEGFICPPSSANILVTMARHVRDSGHGAFTWTGPYGSGKSSLAVVLSALIGGPRRKRQAAASIVGPEVAGIVWAALPPRTSGWRILPVVGRRGDPARTIGEAIEAAGYADSEGEAWTEQRVVRVLADVARRQPRRSGGLLVFIDEMGKFLEAAAHDRGDIYLFQQLAEAAARSDRRLIVVGVLHQAFEEYAHRLTREARDEWSKIQGRFVDLAVNIVGEEQIELLARAIVSDHRPTETEPLAKVIAGAIQRKRPGSSERLADALRDCWPLHPVVACLLGPISRRRFGQNQRSIFGFLNSAEPFGFQDFLRHSDRNAIYDPDRLWDYLQANLEPSILASPDGHRWALAAEAVDRCEARGGDRLHTMLLKCIALIDLFKDRSGLVASRDVLRACAHGHAQSAVEDALRQLESWSFVIYRKFADAYGVYAGSDFDIDKAVDSALEEVAEVDFQALKEAAGLQPMLAKRHFHETGALRWYDVAISPLTEVPEAVAGYRPKNGAVGQFLLAVPTAGETREEAEAICRRASGQAREWDVVVGLSERSWTITQLARELRALEHVREHRNELTGDPVARREIQARLASLQGQLESELRRAFRSATWYVDGRLPKQRSYAELSGLASELADRRFHKSPRLHNELLNRIKPSSNAVAAQNALLRRMASREGEPRLGIDGFPAEGGLFASLLEATGLYTRTSQGWRFVAPHEAGDDPCRLGPIWDAATEYLRRNASRTVKLSELYDLWRQPPFGVRDGLMSLLAVAFILSRRDKVAFYRQGVFQARFKDIDVDYLAKDPSIIQLRWMDLSAISRQLLSGMANVVRELDPDNALAHLTPIDVARGLIGIYDRLHPWTKRTMRLSANAVWLRNLFKQASDPNKFLFDDIPGLMKRPADRIDGPALVHIITNVREGLTELVQAYPVMLGRFRDTMLQELQVPNTSSAALAELRARAANIRELTGDFRLEAFVGRLARFEGTREDVEGIASLAANKPPQNWVDADLDRASMEIADLAQKFIRAEAFARVKGRRDKRHAVAVVVGIGGRPAPVIEEFEVMDADRPAVEELVGKLRVALKDANGLSRNLVLAALAELSARYMQPGDEPLVETDAPVEAGSS